MSVDMLEMGDWSCPECDEVNSDFSKRCHNCGVAKPDDDDTYGNSFNEGDIDDDRDEFGEDNSNE